MKRLSISMALLSLITIRPLPATATQPGHMIKCISGNCMNGTGEAVLTLNDNFVGDIHYTGQFKHALMDGNGVAVYSYGYILIGEFTRNEPSGRCSKWQIKWVGDKAVPDSSAEVVFGKWDEDDVMKGIAVHPDGTTRVVTRGHKYLSTTKMKDSWVNDQVENFLAARRRKM